MPPQRLPIVDGDDGTWGGILRQYLLKEHYDDGTDNAANGGHKTITIRAGTATAGTAPLKFTSGTLLTTPEAGAIEFNTDKLYFTKTTGLARQTVATYDTTGSTGDVYYRDSGANFVRLGIGSTGNVLTVSGGLPTWSNVALTSITSDTTTALGVGSINLGHASDTTITRTGAGAIAVEGVGVTLNSISLAHTAGTIELGHASDTTLARGAAGRLTVEGVNVLTSSSTDTLTNKTLDANGTGNSITNLEVADFAGSAIVTVAEGINSSNNDSSLPTTAAVKGYVDSSGVIAWSQVTGTTQTAAINNGYITNNAARVTVTLPTTAAIGNVVQIVGKGAGGWRVAQNLGQTIHFGNMDTTAGTGGRLDSTSQYDTLQLMCVTANTDWVVVTSVGNIEVV